MTRNDCINLINNFIPDENVRCFIFNSDNLRQRSFLTDKGDILIYLSNILVLSTGIIYGRFVEWKNKKKANEQFDDFTNSMIRIYNSLERVYNNSVVTFEFIDNLMLDLQIDYALRLEMNFLKKLGLNNDFFRFEDKFSKYIYEIQKRRISSRYVNENIGYDQLYTFIQMFPYLRDIKIKYSSIESLYNDKNIFTGLNKIIVEINKPFMDLEYSSELKLNYFLINDGFSNYFLEKINIYDEKFTPESDEKNQIIYLEYIEINWTAKLEIALVNLDNLIERVDKRLIKVSETAVEDLLLYFDITKYQGETSGDNYIFKDFYSFNNRYLKHFALIISDCLNLKIKEHLIRIYKDKYYNVFELLKIGSLTDNVFYRNNYDWDALITILFLEEGVYKVLKTILFHDDIFNDILNKFNLRFVDLVNRISEKTKIMIKNPTYNLLPSDLRSRKKEISCKVDALITLAMELLASSEVRTDNSMLPSNMDYRIDNLLNVLNSKRTNKEKINFYIESTTQMTKMLLVFLESFLEYIKTVNEIDININNYNFILDESEINFVKKKAVENFVSSVNSRKKHYANLDYDSNYSLNQNLIESGKNVIIKTFMKLKEFNRNCNDPNSYENKHMRKAIGKNYLINEEDLQLIITKYNNYLEKIANKNTFSDKCVEEMHTICSEYFTYLQTGNLSRDIEYNPEKAVYPLLGVYSNGIISRDGYLSSYFILDMPGEHEKRIKVLSDDRFQFGEEYFCVPNLNRVARLSKNSEELWVSPIIINYKYFSQNYFATFSRDRHNPKDYPKISELIYKTDENIYCALFGSLENAQKVLPILFNSPRSMFSIDKYVTVKHDDEVIAVGSIYTKETYWDRNIVSAAMRQAGVVEPESFDFVCKYFEDTYNDTSGKDRSLICDICVDEKHRNKGVGKFLLMNIIKTARGSGRDLLITVYANNLAAINLYKSLDFIEYERFLDLRGYNKPEEICIKMIRFSDL